MAELLPHLQTVGTVLQAGSAIAGGAQANRQADSVAAQLDQQAGSSRASAQRAASEQRRQGRLKLSALQARAGGGGLDESLVSLAGDIAGEAEYRALTAMFEGEDRAQGLEAQATARRKEGGQARQAGLIKGVGSVLNAAPGMFEKYWPANKSGVR